MKVVEDKDTVTITYIGKLDNGEVFATITEQQPFVLTLGTQSAPPTLEDALLGMTIGETKSVRLDPEEGFGLRRKDLLQTLDRKAINPEIIPKPGMILSLSVEMDGKEHQIPATIVELSGNTVTVDYNHPLAGHHLTYEVTITDINKSLQ